jgi:putative salt-induced outer membrane protein YdiY
VEILPDLKVAKNLRFNTETALVASLSANIALKVSYVVHFDNLPEPGFKKSDRLLTSGVQVTF